MTPIGTMLAGATDAGLCLLEFTDRPALPKEITDLRRLLKAEMIEGRHDVLELAESQLMEYFRGDRQSFDLPVNAPGTQFQTKIWSILRDITFGSVRTYKDQAMLIGNLGAIRAVGKANGDNRISIIIPCHRVIGANGDLIGYGGGLWRKRYLLEFEAKLTNNLTLFS